MTYDCAVVGGGPAGCAAALFLSRKGRSVILLDRASFPRRKACGEGILPAGVAVLRELGVYAEAAEIGRPFLGVSYTTRDGRETRCRFPKGSGLAVAREELDHLMLRRATKAPGVHVYENCAMLGLERGPEGVRIRLATRTLTARRLIAADGMSSPSLKALGVPRLAPARKRYGLAARLDGITGLGDYVEVFLVPGGEIYLTPLRGEGRASVAVLLEERAFSLASEGREAAFWRLARVHPSLAPRLKNAVLEAPVVGLGPLAATAQRCEDGPWIAAGDAAGAVDPLVGDGIGLALRSGRLAAEATDAALDGGERPGVYTTGRRKLLRPKERLARFALAMSRRPALARAAVWSLRAFPSAFSALLAD